MLVLSFDTSTNQTSIGWAEVFTTDVGKTLGRHGSISLPATPGHGETLLDRIGLALKTGGFSVKDLDLLVYGRGPGTFTGLRIGLATAKSLSMVGEFPIIGVSTLETLALGAAVEGNVVSLLDARRGEVYWGAYRVSFGQWCPSAVPVLAEKVTTADKLVEILEGEKRGGEVLFAGNGFEPYGKILAPVGRWCGSKTAYCDPLVLLARGVELLEENGPDDPAVSQPVYLREPDAKLPSPRWK